MIEKYSKKFDQSSSGFAYLGKMSTDNMLGSLTDDEIDDIAEWAAKKFGLDISSGSKKDNVVIQWVKDAFSEIDKMSTEEKAHLKNIANGVVKPSKFNTTKLMDKVKHDSKITSHYSKWIDSMKDAAGMRGKKEEAWIKYMNKMEQEVKKNMSSDAVDAIKLYSGSSYRKINAWLRSGGKLADAEKHGLREDIAKKVKKS